MGNYLALLSYDWGRSALATGSRHVTTALEASAVTTHSDGQYVNVGGTGGGTVK